MTIDLGKCRCTPPDWHDRHRGRTRGRPLPDTGGGWRPQPESAELPLLGGNTEHLSPHPLRFPESAAWFAVTSELQIDFVRTGGAEGPAAMADGLVYTLVALYKGGRPVASFIVESRRNALISLSVYDAGE